MVASLIAASGGLISTEFTVDVINVGGSAGPPSVPVFMTIGESARRQVHEFDRPDRGQIVSFVVTRDLPLGRHNVSFIVGDWERSIEVYVKSSDIVLEALPHSITGEGSINLSFSVTNQGSLPAVMVSVFANWDIHATSTDDGSAHERTSDLIDALGVGESKVVTLPVSIPSGSYIFTLEAETESIEVRQDNNAAETVVEVDYVNLVPFIQSKTVLGYELDGTATTEIAVQVSNIGVAPSGPISLGVSCLDKTIESCSQELTVDSVPPGTSTAVLATLALPQGVTPVTVFAGAPDDGYRWGGANVQQATIAVPHLSVREALALLPWVKDGISSGPDPTLVSPLLPPEWMERHIVNTLTRHYESGRTDLCWAFISKPWFQDGLDFVEARVFFTMAEHDEQATVQILKMPFMQTIEPSDAVVLESLNDLNYAGLLPNLVSHPALQVDIMGDRLGTLILVTLELLRPEAAAELHTWPWIQDGVSIAELNGVEVLRSAATESEQVFWVLTDKPWVQDGLSQAERNAIAELALMGSERYSTANVGAALAIAQMPFLETLEDIDAKAVEALSLLTSILPDVDRTLDRVLAHPTLQGGITDDHTMRIAFLSSASSALRSASKVEPMDVMFGVIDPSLSTLEEREIALPLAGDVTLAALYSASGAGSAMDALEHAVRTHEAIMGTPFPVNLVRIWLAPDIGGPGGGGGPAGDIHIVKNRFTDLHSIIAHEAAHIYWGGVVMWVSEGAATFMDILSENLRIGTPAKPLSGGRCNNYSNLKQLEESSYGGICDYTMGSGFFFDLYRNLGEDAFRKGFRELYFTLYSNKPLTERCTAPEFTACHLTNAFVANADQEAAAIAEPIINRWYYGR